MIRDEDLLTLILGCGYRLATEGRDRGGGATPRSRINYGTGVPESANDHAPRWMHATGRQLAMEQMFEPRDLAMAILRRREQVGGVEQHRALKFISPDDWSSAECDLVAEMEHRIKLAVRRAADKDQWFDCEPFRGADERVMAADGAGLPTFYRFTHQGLQEAFRRAREPKYAKWIQGPKSIKDAVGAEIWKQAPQWLKDDAR